ncbi:MAG: tetratricopeptide repeat protein [Acidobacteria bacterium]|nr:tetratricopeptide repeat protein [Acidobacteriota bacterium]
MRRLIKLAVFVLSLSLIIRVSHASSSARTQSLPNSAATTQEREDPTDKQLAEASALLEIGRATDAEPKVREFLAAHPNSADGHFLMGHVLFHEIQEEAKAQANTSVADGLSLSNGSRSERNQERARSSLREFTAGAKLRDPTAADLKVVAFDYVLLGDYVDADRWLTRMLVSTSNDADGWYYLGRAKYIENRFDEAINAFEHALKLSPGNPKFEDNLGLAYAGLNRTNEALVAYKTAIEWQSQSASKSSAPYIDIADLLLDQSHPADAIAYLQQAIALAPNDSKAHELLGKAYLRLDDLPKGQWELENALRLAPQNKNVHCMLAPVYRKQGQAEKAKSESEQCVSSARSNSIAETPRP